MRKIVKQFGIVLQFHFHETFFFVQACPLPGKPETDVKIQIVVYA